MQLFPKRPHDIIGLPKKYISLSHTKSWDTLSICAVSLKAARRSCDSLGISIKRIIVLPFTNSSTCFTRVYNSSLRRNKQFYANVSNGFAKVLSFIFFSREEIKCGDRIISRRLLYSQLIWIFICRHNINIGASYNGSESEWIIEIYWHELN